MTDDLYDFARFENTVGKLICAARESGTEVIYVRHDDGEGEELTKGKAGFEIYDGFKPQPGEKIFTKTVNSCFKESGLRDSWLIIASMRPSSAALNMVFPS